MVQITATLSSLTQSQRESLADFIRAFPSTSAEDEPAAISNLIAQDDEEADAATVFGNHIPEATDEDLEAAAIFGATSIPGEPAPLQAYPIVPAPGPVLVPNPPAADTPAPVAADDRLDKSGLPWDERIHASSRAKTADGSWRKKRGIDDATVALVEAELKALMMLPGAAAPAVPEPTTSVFPPAARIPSPPVPAAVAEDRQAYVNLLSVASAAINAKTLTTEQLNDAVAAVGVPSLPLLGNRLDLVPQVMAAVKAIIG